MSTLGRTRQHLDNAHSAFKRIEHETAQKWNDSARRSFDARITQPMDVAVRQYAATLATLDSTIADCLRLAGH